MELHDIQWEQFGSHDEHLSVMNYKKRTAGAGGQGFRKIHLQAVKEAGGYKGCGAD